MLCVLSHTKLEFLPLCRQYRGFSFVHHEIEVDILVIALGHPPERGSI